VTLKIIKDPVHGYIEVEDFARGLMDAPALQRLRYVRQLGFSFLVYPGANHTRFEHSLGTMYLADVACRRFQLATDERQLVVAAALLHDIGHGPFSHASEPLMEKYLHRTHDDLVPILEGTVGGLLRQQGIDPGELCTVVNGTHRLSAIIHGDFDVDRMDYLLRDAYYTGAPYGTVDAQRLIRHLIWTDRGAVLDENGVNAAESLLIARTLMRPTVYYHHVSRIGESMFELAALAHLEETEGKEAEQFLRLDDAGCMHTLANSGSLVSREIMSRLYERRLYKRAITVGSEQVSVAAYQDGISLEKSREYAARIAQLAGIRPQDVLVDIPAVPSEMSLAVRVRNRYSDTSFEELSPRVRTLNATRREQWRLGIYTLPAYREQVADAACEILHIRKPTRQDTLF
jgi:HD superfamily phosphohydrolase